MNLSSENVEKVFFDCLFKPGESTENHKIGLGILRNFSLHPDRLAIHEAEIISMLACLPDSFKKSIGGGMSFLNMCEDKQGNQWGEHNTMEQLCVLGNALGKLSFPMPKEMWGALPGGMPYVSIDV